MLHRKGLVLTGSAAVFLLAVGVAVIIGINNMLLPVNAGAGDETVLVTIPAGAGAEQIGDLLAGKGIIHNSLFFRLYTRYLGLDKEFIAGDYRLSPAMTMREVIEKITSGDVFQDTIWFTVPEGKTVEEIAALLAGEGIVDAERFLALAKQPPADLVAQYPFLAEIPGEVLFTLEGYLFPDTYEILRGASEEDILRLMLRRFDEKMSPELRQRAEELGLSIHEAVTLASIVEKEAVVDHERARIASVFHNRYACGHALQSCATVQYLLEEFKPVLSLQDLEIDSPYNTYLYPGLPPGPIGAPGESSLQAALYPENGDYFYFVSKEDGSGEHYFSRTLDEHEYYRRLAEENRRQ